MELIFPRVMLGSSASAETLPWIPKALELRTGWRKGFGVCAPVAGSTDGALLKLLAASWRHRLTTSRRLVQRALAEPEPAELRSKGACHPDPKARGCLAGSKACGDSLSLPTSLYDTGKAASFLQCVRKRLGNFKCPYGNCREDRVCI